ncbi:hypothetical protein RJ641_029571 [Dillenia turbinata]|uniref:Uncharacterized protein n=1 Tax=Dillenia turbinata TaxID=194707 RepID=A0AAN8VTP1_9MAGN
MYDKDLNEERKSLNVNEEYLCALRTNSIADFFTKAQLLANKPISPSFSCHRTFSECLLEPGQETITAILESMTVLSTKPGLKNMQLHSQRHHASSTEIPELRKRSKGFRQQVEELEEHVYLCLVTINRARALVMKQIAASHCDQSSQGFGDEADCCFTLCSKSNVVAFRRIFVRYY